MICACNFLKLWFMHFKNCTNVFPLREQVLAWRHHSLPSFFITVQNICLFFFSWTCVYMYVCVIYVYKLKHKHTRADTHVHIGICRGERLMPSVFLNHTPPYLRHGLSWTSSSAIELDWLAPKILLSPSPSAEIIDMRCHAHLYISAGDQNSGFHTHVADTL